MFCLKRLLGGWVVRFVVILFLHLSFVICHLSFAQEAPRFYGEEVVVTASRLPQLASKSPWNTSVITSQELKNFRTVGEVLRMVAGVDSISYGYLGATNSVRLRGANASQVLILVDGRRINSPTLGMFDVGDLLVDNIEKIEVVRAPLSAVYGSDAVSGVINIITKSPKEAERFFSISAGSFGTQQYKFSVGGENYLFSGDYIKSDGFRTNSDYLAKNVYGKLTFPIPFGQLLVDYNYYDAAKGAPNVPTSEADPTSSSSPNDRQADKNTLVSLKLKGDNCSLRVYQNVLDQKFDSFSIWGVATTETTAFRTGIEWEQNLSQSIGRILYGVEAWEDRGKGTTLGDHTVRSYAAFLQDEIQFGEQFSLTASIRGDKHSFAGTSINPRLGIVYQPAGDLILRASAGTAFRAPTINDLYWSSVREFGDANLKPEKSISYDLGIERRLSDNSSAKLNYFMSNTTDLILWDWYTTTESRAKNVGEVDNEGLEFELTRKFGGESKGFVNFTYQKAIDKQDRDLLAVEKTIPYTPQIKYNVGFVYEGGSVIVRHVGERYADGHNTIKLPAYTIVDLKLSKKVRGFTIDFLVENLLDEKYSEAVGTYYNPVTYAFENRNYPMPGRRYSIGVKWGI